ncbi:hypothetical protein B0T21DRAFT_374696 [Apiosordaria backusii]|uniref:Uncharacterized protein n=1 Tax=Apiosordaria backusii TaxID=314023 RepID=A0AA40ANJ4_9PEZI|nr:hypothetical protein B0T21DRAFT_374696 [Apiosordaria backusii]
MKADLSVTCLVAETTTQRPVCAATDTYPDCRQVGIPDWKVNEPAERSSILPVFPPLFFDQRKQQFTPFPLIPLAIITFRIKFDKTIITMGDRCIFVLWGGPGLDQPPGLPPVISLDIHEEILPRWWQCQACNSSTHCNVYQVHLNPLVSTTNPVTGLANLGQPLLPPGTSSSHLESSSSDSDDIPNNKDWKPSKRMIAHKSRQDKRPKERRVQYAHKTEPSVCYFCSKPMTPSSTLLNKFFSPICTLSGQNLIDDRFIPRGIQCCNCTRPHFLSFRPLSPEQGHNQDQSRSQPQTTQDGPRKRSHINYQPTTAPSPRSPPIPCKHCCESTTSEVVRIHEKAAQEACGGDCWVISAYGERLAKIRDLFTPVSLPWLLAPVATANQDGQRQASGEQQKQGLLHRHERLCEEYLSQCRLDLSSEIARKARLHAKLRETAVRSVDRDHLRRSALGSCTPRADKEMAAVEKRVKKAEEKLAEAEERRRNVLEKIEEARMWVLGVLNGPRPVCEHALDNGDLDEDGMPDADAEMDDSNDTSGDGNETGIEPAQDYEGDMNENTDDRGNEGQSTPRNHNEKAKIDWHNAPIPMADPGYERYCAIKGIPMYETKARKK